MSTLPTYKSHKLRVEKILRAPTLVTCKLMALEHLLSVKLMLALITTYNSKHIWINDVRIASYIARRH